MGEKAEKNEEKDIENTNPQNEKSICGGLDTIKNLYNIKKFFCLINNFYIVLKKSIIWILLSYLIPIINIGIIIGISKQPQKSHLGIVNIVLATNACFIIGAMNYIYSSNKDREFARFLAIIGLTTCITTFGISTYEIEKKITDGFTQIFYDICAMESFVICLVLAYISQKDELEKIKAANNILQKAKNIDKFDIDGKTFKV